jgi:hypothetical protein
MIRVGSRAPQQKESKYDLYKLKLLLLWLEVTTSILLHSVFRTLLSVSVQNQTGTCADTVGRVA